MELSHRRLLLALRGGWDNGVGAQGCGREGGESGAGGTTGGQRPGVRHARLARSRLPAAGAPAGPPPRRPRARSLTRVAPIRSHPRAPRKTLPPIPPPGRAHHDGQARADHRRGRLGAGRSLEMPRGPQRARGAPVSSEITRPNRNLQTRGSPGRSQGLPRGQQSWQAPYVAPLAAGSRSAVAAARRAAAPRARARRPQRPAVHHPAHACLASPGPLPCTRVPPRTRRADRLLVSASPAGGASQRGRGAAALRARHPAATPPRPPPPPPLPRAPSRPHLRPPPRAPPAGSAPWSPPAACWAPTRR
jgi:hypothetical protein